MDSCQNLFLLLWIVISSYSVHSIRHGQNLIWAQVPSIKSTVSRLVGIEGDPDVWVKTKAVTTRYISAPHLGWEFTALAYDYSTKTLLWSESINKRIQSLVLNESIDTTDVFTGTSPEVHGMAVDWQSGNLYWTDALYNWIIMAPIHSTEKTRTYKIILQSGLDDPHGIAVHTERGLLLWSDRGEYPRIEMSDLLGGNRRILVDESMEHPRDITLDEDTVYWVDSHKDTVEAVNIDGTGRRLVEHQDGSNYFGIAVYSDYLFVTEQSKGLLKIMDKMTGERYTNYRLGHIPYDILMYTNYTSGSRAGCDAMECEQFCVDMPDTGPKCYCGEGFNSTDDGKTCELTRVFVQPSHIYAVNDAICHYPANVADMALQNVSLDKQCFLDKRGGYLALTYDARENFLYYSENNTKTIKRIHLEIGAAAETIAGGTGIVLGMCIDWISGNVYWTDSSHQVIRVANKHGTYQKDLVTTNLDYPLGIAVHPGRSRLYFTDPGKQPKVEMVYTDGTERTVIMSDNLGSPNHLFVDYVKDILYWSDSDLNHVRSYDLETTKIKIVFRQDKANIYGLSLFRDFILWTDRNEMNGIHMAHMENEEKIRGIIHPNYGIAHDLLTFDIHNQPMFNSSCKESENPCDQLCLSSGDNVWCTCGLGYELGDDHTTCLSNVVRDNFLLVSDAYQKQVFQINSDNGVVHAVYHPTKQSPIAVSFDPAKMKLHWSDNNLNIIKASFLDGNFAEIVLSLDKDSVVDGLDVDHINRLLYYTDAGKKIIGVVSLDNYKNKRVLLKEKLDQPRAITLLPVEGMLYWTDWGVEPRIERASMDGSDRSIFLRLDKNSWPNGITIDRKSRRLFWVDAQFNTVSVICLNGTGRRVMLKEDIAHYFGIALMGNFLYITDWKKTYISRMHKDGGALEIFGTKSFTKLYGIYGFNKTEVPRANSPCLLYSCGQLCLPRPHNLVTCACSDGYRLSDDNTSCIKDITLAPTTTTPTIVPITSPSPNSATVIKPVTMNKIPALSSTSSSLTSSPPSSSRPSPVTISASPSTTLSMGNESTGKSNENIPTQKHGSAAVVKSPVGLSYEATVAVAIIVVVAVIIAVVVAVILYRRHRNYKIPHGPLLEDDPKRVDTFYRITFPDNKDEPILVESGIENPAYDCVSDDENDKGAFNVH